MEKPRKKTREIILDAIKQNPQITISELCTISGLTKPGVEWNLSRLKAGGLLRRIGPDKGGHWEVQT